MRHAVAALLLVVLLVGVTSTPPARSAEPAAPGVVERTQAWLSRLSPRQRSGVLHAFDGRERTNWHYVPRNRAGLALGAMDETARRDVLGLFAGALGAKSWAKAEAVFRLEAVLRRRAVAANPNVPTSWRDPLLYFVSVFGAPRPGATWGLRLEGHHLSVNLTFDGSALRAATPLFFGANPASARPGDGSVLRPLGAEEDLALRLMSALDAAWRRRAIAGRRAPGDVVFGPGRAPVASGQGLPATTLREDQRSLLRALVDEHRPGPPVSDAELAAARIVWMGGLRPGADLYYRIEAPTFLIEHRNLGAHVHSLWRDPRGDFGAR